MRMLTSTATKSLSHVSVGDEVGLMMGNAVGLGVGCLVGDEVGLAVGDEVGAALVGTGVGALLGLATGAQEDPKLVSSELPNFPTPSLTISPPYFTE